MDKFVGADSPPLRWSIKKNVTDTIGRVTRSVARITQPICIVHPSVFSLQVREMYAAAVFFKSSAALVYLKERSQRTFLRFLVAL